MVGFCRAVEKLLLTIFGMLAFSNRFFIFDSEGLLLPRKSGKKLNLMNSDTFKFGKDKIAEGSKGRRNPLELLPGHLLEEPFHFSLQKTETVAGITVWGLNPCLVSNFLRKYLKPTLRTDASLSRPFRQVKRFLFTLVTPQSWIRLGWDGLPSETLESGSFEGGNQRGVLKGLL